MVLRDTAVTAAALLLLIAACSDDTTAPIVYPAAISPSASTVWGTLGGVDIVGGYGSAIAVDPRDASILYALTDRGPNVATLVANQLFFPIPAFNPQIAKFRLVGGQLQKLSSIELKNAGGARLSGIPNPSGQGGTGETAVGPNATPLVLDPDGIDSEGLAFATDGSFWVSDEYGPHIVHFDATGRTIERINPFGAGTGGRRIPAVLSKRRPNRGMEGLTITPDGKTLVGMMQSPLDNPTSAIGRQSNALRILTFDIASGETKQYVYLTEAVGLLVSEIAAITNTAFLVLERDGNYAGSTTAPSRAKHVYRIDLTGATDVSDPGNAAGGKLFGGTVVEALSPAELTANGITPVTRTLVYNLLTHPGGYPHDKAEGIALIGGKTLVVANDDDFGVIDNGQSAIAPKNLPSGQRDTMTLYFITLPVALR